MTSTCSDGLVGDDDVKAVGVKGTSLSRHELCKEVRWTLRFAMGGDGSRMAARLGHERD